MDVQSVAESALKLIHKLGSGPGRPEGERADQAVKQLTRAVQNLHVTSQKWKEKAERHMRDYKALRVSISKPFVLALIDGDAAAFCDELLAGNEDGGTRAAVRLRADILAHIRHSHPEIAMRNPDVVIYYVVNMRGAASYLGRRGIIKAGEEGLLAFARGFAGTQAMCFVVDVKSGKDRADCKIKELLQFHAGLPQCAHVVFGPCHDKGYLPTLELYALRSGAKRSRRGGRKEEGDGPVPAMSFSLLETTNTYPEFKALGLPMVSFPSVFRSQPRTERQPEEENKEAIVAVTPSDTGPASSRVSRPLDPAAPCFYVHDKSDTKQRSPSAPKSMLGETESESTPARIEDEAAKAKITGDDVLETPSTESEKRDTSSSPKAPRYTAIRYGGQKHVTFAEQTPVSESNSQDAIEKDHPGTSHLTKGKGEALRLSRPRGYERRLRRKENATVRVMRRGRRRGQLPQLPQLSLLPVAPEQLSLQAPGGPLGSGHQLSEAAPSGLERAKTQTETVTPKPASVSKVTRPRVEAVDVPYYRESLLD